MTQKNLELYCSKYYSTNANGHQASGFQVSPVFGGELDGECTSCYNTESGVAYGVIRNLFPEEGSRVVYDRLVLYSSVDGKVEGQPSITATRNEVTLVRALHQDSNELYRIFEAMGERIREKH